MKEICSTTYSSILRDSNEGVKQFNWETIWLELLQKMPTLLNLLACLVKDPNKSKSMLCLIISMILKERLSHMCLVQRGISVLMYGNGTSKQVRGTNYIKLKDKLIITIYFHLYSIQDIQLSSTSSNKPVS